MEKELLILRHLDGTLDADEKVLFNKLVSEDLDFKMLLSQYEAIWKNTEQHSKKIQSNSIDVESFWNDFNQNVKPKAKIVSSKRFLLNRYLQVAAILLVVLSAIFIAQRSQVENVEFATAMSTMSSRKTCLSMNDGSDIYLDGNSALDVDLNYNREKRTTRLSGTAFFVVKPDKDKVFEVVTSHLKTIVKGTTFLIRTNDHFTTVGVQTGLVEVQFGNQTEKLRAGEQIVVSANGEVIERSVLDSDAVQQLKSDTRIFHDATLSTILKHIQVLYEIQIEADLELMDQRYTVDFSHVTKDQVVSLISTLTRTSYHKNGEIYILKQ